MSFGSKTRRQMLSQSGALLGLAALPKVARAAPSLQPVEVMLDWLYQGPNCGFLVAKDKGFYSDAGLSVTVTAGKGSGATAQMVASKVAQFGLVDGYVMANGVSKGMKLKMVADIYRRNPNAVLTLKSSGLVAPKQLENKKIGITVGSSQFQQWPAFVKGAGLDASKIQVINVDLTNAPAALITGQVDAIAGFAQGLAPSVEIRGGKEVNLLWFADVGVQAVSNGIVVDEDTLNQKPDLVKAFVAASLRGWLYSRQNPEEAIAIIKRASPVVNEAVTRREMELSWNTWVTPNTANKPLGWMADQDWASTVEILKQYGGVQAALDPQSLYTNAFVPNDPAFIPPQG